MDNLTQLKRVGEELGLSGRKLQRFITEQQKEQKDEHRRQLEILDARSKIVSESVIPKPPTLPYFNESQDDMDSYLERFERYATSYKWERKYWGMNLSALLRGKALDVFARLPEERATDFEYLKEALLNAFRLTEEGFREKFRSEKPYSDETWVQFSSRLSHYLVRWIELGKSTNDFDLLVDMLLREQLLCNCSSDLKVFIMERKPKSLPQMAKLADLYTEAHGGSILSTVLRPCHQEKKCDKVVSSSNCLSVGVVKSKSETNVDSSRRHSSRSNNPYHHRKCYACHRYGHIAQSCTRQKLGIVQKPRNVEKKVVASCCVTNPTRKLCVVDSDRVGSQNSSAISNRPSELLITQGKVDGHVASVLRDTGCTDVVVKQSLVGDDKLTGQFRKCTLIDGTSRSVPIAVVEIQTQYLSGIVEALCFDDPVCDIIVGNVLDVNEQFSPG